MPEMPERDDSEIIRGLGREDSREAAFNQLVLAYQERLYWHIRKIVVSHDDSDDVLQNTLLKVWRSAGNFRGESGLYTWLYRIATNEALSFLKQKKRKSLAPWASVESSLSDGLEADPWFDGDEAQLRFQKAILTLPEKQRLVFNMKYFDNMKYEEMSEVLGTSVGALKASYHHAVKKLEKLLGDE